jgi:hypothetical protein
MNYITSEVIQFFFFNWIVILSGKRTWIKEVIIFNFFLFPNINVTDHRLQINKQTSKPLALVSKQTIPTELLPLVGEISANFLDKGCCVVNTTGSYGCILGFLDRSCQVAPQLYS